MSKKRKVKKQNRKKGCTSSRANLSFHYHLCITLLSCNQIWKLLHLQMKMVDMVDNLQMAWQDAIQHGCGPSLQCFWQNCVVRVSTGPHCDVPSLKESAYSPGVDSASNRNEYQESSWGLRAADT
jgi:hypothetical protein